MALNEKGPAIKISDNIAAKKHASGTKLTSSVGRLVSRIIGPMPKVSQILLEEY